jgi:hypothetical protein
MLYVDGTCPCCDAGMMGFRICSDGITVVVVCDECDRAWFDARRLGTADAEAVNLPRWRIADSEVFLEGSRWATRGEVEAAGWGDLVAGDDQLPR